MGRAHPTSVTEWWRERVTGAIGVNRRILVIDDNRAIHDDFSKILGGAGRRSPALAAAEAGLFGEASEPPILTLFEIDSAFQGQDAMPLVEKARSEGRPYALAFVDVRMPPGWDGVETVKRLWELAPDLQVVICTAYSDYSWESMIRELGVSDRLLVLKKPFDTVEVIQLAHALTEKWRLLQLANFQREGLQQLVADKTRELWTTNGQLLQEVNERTAAEEKLRATQARLQHLLAHSPVVIYSETVEGLERTPFWVSDNLELVLGWSDRDWRRPGWFSEQLHPDDAESAEESLRCLFRVGRARAEYRLRHGEGHYCWIHDERRVLWDAAGNPSQVVGAWTDVTQRRHLEERLRESQKLEAIGRLAGGVAHDFNNLISVIDGYTDILLSDDQLDPEVAESVREIAGAASRAATLTRQLLAYGRRQSLDLRPIDLNGLARSFGKMCQPILGGGVSLRLDLPADPVFVPVDRSMIEQVLLNLVVNGRDAMPLGGELVVGVESLEIIDENLPAHPLGRVGCFVCLKVRDTGRGIAPEVAERMFEPFFTTKEVGKGTGLGLAMVYGIARQHRGWVEVETELGRGSVFTVYLPMDKPLSDSSTACFSLEVSGAPERNVA